MKALKSKIGRTLASLGKAYLNYSLDIGDHFAATVIIMLPPCDIVKYVLEDVSTARKAVDVFWGRPEILKKIIMRTPVHILKDILCSTTEIKNVLCRGSLLADPEMN